MNGSPDTSSIEQAPAKYALSRRVGGACGRIGPGRFWVADFSVDGTSGSTADFVCTPEHHQRALDAFFERTGADYRRFNYLGEWHSHPRFPVAASSVDGASMRALVHGERDIAFAVLMIVRLRYGFCLESSASMFSRHQRPEAVCIIRDRWFGDPNRTAKA